jgi:hypothetical protein
MSDRRIPTFPEPDPPLDQTGNSPPKITATIRMSEVDELSEQLLDIVDGVKDSEYLVARRMRYQDEYDQAVCVAVCRWTKMTPERWRQLRLPQEKDPWLRDATKNALAHRRKTQAALAGERQPAETAAPTSDDTSPNEQIALDDEDVNILNALKRNAPRLLSQEQIEGHSGVGRKTISKRLKALEAHGLISRRGKKGGCTITQKGIDTMTKLPSAKNTQ